MASLVELFNVGATWSGFIIMLLTLIGLIWIFLSTSKTDLFVKIMFLLMVIATLLSFLALMGTNLNTKKGFLYVPLIFTIITLIVAWIYNVRLKDNFSRIVTFVIGILSMIVIVIDGYLLSFPTPINDWVPLS